MKRETLYFLQPPKSKILPKMNFPFKNLTWLTFAYKFETKTDSLAKNLEVWLLLV